MARARLSAFGSYRGAPAIEYEVLDGQGVTIARDYVVLRPLPGETWEDLVSFVRDIVLPPRLARHELGSPKETRQSRVPGAPMHVRGELPPAHLLGTEIEVTRAEAEAWQQARQSRPVRQKPPGTRPVRHTEVIDAE